MSNRPIKGFALVLILAALVISCVRSQEDPFVASLTPFLAPTARTVLIIGDSLTDISQGFGLATRLGPEYRVFYQGAPGYDFQNWLIRLAQAVSSFSDSPPGIILVPLGTNDGYRFGPADFALNLEAFHQELRRYSQARVIYFQVPRTRQAGLSSAILANNATLSAHVPGDNTELKNLDSIFENSALYHLLYEGLDEVHPTNHGYELIGEEMRRIVTGAIF